MPKLLLVPAIAIHRRSVVPYIPYGLLALQAVASSYTTTVDILRLPNDIRNKTFASAVALYEYLFSEVRLEEFDVIGFSTIIDSFCHTLAMTDLVARRVPAAKIVYGGPFVTKTADQVLKTFPRVDAIFVGESEISFSEFLGRCDRGHIGFDGIAGVATRSSQHCGAPVIEDLDDLPFITTAPDFGAWWDLCGRPSSIPLEASRGCPLQCSFCSTRQVWGARVRRKSARRLTQEMDLLSALCADGTFFNFIGDNLGVPRAPFMSFCQELATVNRRYRWGCSLKLDRLDPTHLTTMWEAGARAMFVGIESGNQQTLDRVRKKTNIERELANVGAAIDIGFKVDVSLIIGFPWESFEDVKETLSLHHRLLRQGANRSQIGILIPIPGTDIVPEGIIRFDPNGINVFEDYLLHKDDLRGHVATNPDLFSFLGFYDTPLITRASLQTVKDAAARVSASHSRRENWNFVEGVSV